jgi:hypothetical protein
MRDLVIGQNPVGRKSVGHNSAGITVSTEVRLFNSISRLGGEGGMFRRLELPAGSDLGDVLRRLSIPPGEVFLVFVNGRDITPTLNAGIRTGYVIEDGDVIALSGPVPYSWGYGAPVV